MPLRQWIILNLDNFSAVGDGGVTVGGQAEYRLAATNHSMHGGGRGSGSALVQEVYTITGVGGAVGSGSAIVTFDHIIPPTPKTYFKKIRWMPGDIVWDDHNTKYVVEELFAGVGDNRYLCNHAGEKYLLLEDQLEDSPVYPSLIDCDYDFPKRIKQLQDSPLTTRSYPGTKATKTTPLDMPIFPDYQRKIEQLQDSPVTTRSYPGVRATKAEDSPTPPLIDCDYDFSKKIKQLQDSPVTTRSYPGVRATKTTPLDVPIFPDYQRKLKQLQESPLTTRSYPGVKTTKVEV